MAKNESILRFEGVSFEYKELAPLLDEVDFSVRRGTKITVMGQNGAGKSTIFKLIAGEIFPESGNVIVGIKPGIFWHPTEVFFFLIIRLLSTRPVLIWSAPTFLPKSLMMTWMSLNPTTK